MYAFSSSRYAFIAVYDYELKVHLLGKTVYQGEP